MIVCAVGTRDTPKKKRQLRTQRIMTAIHQEPLSNTATDYDAELSAAVADDSSDSSMTR
jgi:hypothetical protein